MSTRNFEEYRAEVLEQLGATAEDLRNEASWRAKVLEALGAEYTDEDTRNFERYRLKVLENLSGGGGGGSSWQTVFEGSVTTEVDGYGASGDIDEGIDITADTLRVTFNGIEYTCEMLDDGSYGAPYQKGTGYDWSEYPFSIYDGGMKIATETAGTYTLKIEEPQSGGSSDFSTAEVTVSGLSEGEALEINALEEIDGKNYITGIGNGTSSVILYQGSISGYAMYPMADITLTGNATKEDADGDTIVTITGDCTITIS